MFLVLNPSREGRVRGGFPPPITNSEHLYTSALS